MEYPTKPQKVKDKSQKEIIEERRRKRNEMLKNLDTKKNPVNSVGFTVHVLENLHEFIESDLVAKLHYFSDYDKQALLDAVYYLNDYNKLLQIMDRARKIAFEEEEEEEERPRFKMDANGNLTRIEE